VAAFMNPLYREVILYTSLKNILGLLFLRNASANASAPPRARKNGGRRRGTIAEGRGKGISFADQAAVGFKRRCALRGAAEPLPLAAGYTYMRWFHKPSGRLMVATPTMRDELAKHGFRNLSPWSRGVDTDIFKPRQPDEPDLFEGLARPIFLNVGRVAVEKNIEAFASLDLPGTKVVIGDGPQREELAEKYPEVKFLGAKFGDELGRYFGCADVFCFPSLTDTFGLVILEAMAAGVPVAAFSAPGPVDIIPGSNAGVLAPGQTEGLREACLACLDLDRTVVRKFAERFSWRACAEEFFRNLQPYPEPEKTRFWRRLRRLARLRKKTAA
jgi:glycosyltransferase involved in cell wall biosynthesis